MKKQFILLTLTSIITYAPVFAMDLGKMLNEQDATIEDVITKSNIEKINAIFLLNSINQNSSNNSNNDFTIERLFPEEISQEQRNKKNTFNHIQTSEKKKRFVCAYDGCNYSNNGKGNFDIHIRKHTGEKPFACLNHGCYYATGNSGNLKKHQRTCRYDPSGQNKHKHPSNRVDLKIKKTNKKTNKNDVNLLNQNFIYLPQEYEAEYKKLGEKIIAITYENDITDNNNSSNQKSNNNDLSSLSEE